MHSHSFFALPGHKNLVGATKYWLMAIDLRMYLFQVNGSYSFLSSAESNSNADCCCHLPLRLPGTSRITHIPPASPRSSRRPNVDEDGFSVWACLSSGQCRQSCWYDSDPKQGYVLSTGGELSAVARAEAWTQCDESFFWTVDSCPVTCQSLLTSNVYGSCDLIKNR